MKSLVGRVAAAVLFVFCLVTPRVLFARSTTITVLHVNDTHSHLDAFGPKDRHLDGTLGGLGKAASVINYLKATNPNVLFLHAGDLMHGDFMFQEYFGVPELQMLQQMGLDAMTSGNHEWDFGPDFLTSALSSAFPHGGFPILSANIDLTGYPPLQSFIQPNIIKRVGEVPVGIFGLTTPWDPNMQMGSATMLGGDPAVLMNIASEQAATLRAAGAQVVILLSHLGVDVDEQVAASVPGIDFIIGGHTHTVLAQAESITNPTGGKTYVVQAGSYYQYVGKLQVTVNNGVASLASYTLVPVDAAVPESITLAPTVRQLNAGIVAQFGDVYHTPIGYALWDIGATTDPTKPNRDTPLGNLIADSYRQNSPASIALVVSGLYDQDLTHGWIVENDVWHGLGYGFDESTRLGFNLATLQLTGAQILAGLEATVDLGGAFLIQVSGMEYAYDSRLSAGGRVIPSSVRIGKHPVDPAKVYDVTVNTGVLDQLPQFGIVPQNVKVLPDFEYTNLVDFISALKVVAYTSIGRVKDVAYSSAPTHH